MNKLLLLAGITLMMPSFNGHAEVSEMPVPTNTIHQTITHDEEKAIIHGQLQDMDAQDSILVRAEGLNDTIVAQNGAFDFVYANDKIGLVNFYQMAKYLGNGKYTPFRMIPISVVTHPNTSVTITGNFDTYKVTGNDFYKEYNSMNGPLEANNHRKIEMANHFLELKKANQATPEMQKELMTEFEKMNAENEQTIEKYVAAHLDAPVSIFLLYYYRPAVGEKYINQISENVRTGEMADFYVKAKNHYEKVAAKREAAKHIQPGKPAPAFTLKDIKGADFSLASLKGKYVVLDFWGSWCGWCIKGIPDMKKMYEQYKGKLEIVGIDCNDPEAKWKAAVEKYQLPWINVINNPKGGTNLTNTYNIEGFPTKIIISPEGNIVKVVVGEDPTFYTTIDELMK